MNRPPIPLLKLAAIPFLAYLLLSLFACNFADRLIFRPDLTGHRISPAVATLDTGDGKLGVLYLPNPSAKYTIWYFHGNAEDLADCEPVLREFNAHGFTVFAFDYPGYGLSTGEPSEKTVNHAAILAKKYLTKTLGVPPKRILLFGRSVGGGPALQIATTDKFAGLILQSAFTSAFRVLTRVKILPFDEFDNLAVIPRITFPIYIIQGTDDEVVPSSDGPQLFKAATARKQCFWVNGAHHNDVLTVAGAEYWTRLDNFIRFASANPQTPPAAPQGH